MKSGRKRKSARREKLRLCRYYKFTFTSTFDTHCRLFKNYDIVPSKNLKRKAKRYGGAAEERMGEILARVDKPLRMRYAKFSDTPKSDTE